MCDPNGYCYKVQGEVGHENAHTSYLYSSTDQFSVIDTFNGYMQTFLTSTDVQNFHSLDRYVIPGNPCCTMCD